MSDALRSFMRDALLTAQAAPSDNQDRVAIAYMNLGAVVGLAFGGEAQGWMTTHEAAGWRADALTVARELGYRLRVHMADAAAKGV